MSKTTKNLELFEYDTQTDGKKKFNITKALNNNFDKIDTAIGDLQKKTAGAGLPPSICENLKITKSGTTVTLQWKDPNDTILDKQYLCTWAGTKIVKKLGEYPKNENDGILVLDNTVHNQYAEVGYIDTLDNADDEYKYAAFPYSTNDVFCRNSTNRFGGEIVYEFLINDNEINPDEKIIYCGRNEDFKPVKMNTTTKKFDWGSWKNSFIVNAFRMCMLKSNGDVDYYLNPHNAKQKLDGSPSDATNKDYDGNVMVEVDQIWISESYKNGMLYIKLANKKVDETYDCLSHINKNNQLVEHYYYAKYNGYVYNNKYRSLSGFAPTTNLSGVIQRQYCQANGSGWECREVSFLRLMIYVHLLLGKSTNVQTTFGTGRYTGGSQQSYAQLTSGDNDTKGEFYCGGDNQCVTTFFIDNFWGNVWELTLGLIQNAGKLLYKLTPNTYDGTTATDYNTDGTGYKDSGVNVGTGTITMQFISAMKLVSGIGLVPCAFTGASSSTGWCDAFWTTNVIGYARTSGCSSSGGALAHGLFALTVHHVATSSVWHYGASLSYKKTS